MHQNNSKLVVIGRLLGLVRVQNILIMGANLCLLQALVTLLRTGKTDLWNLTFFCLVLASVFAAAAGNVINDILDVKADQVNKPDKCIVGRAVSTGLAWRFYGLLLLMSVFLALYCGIVWGIWLVVINLSLFFYSKYFKHKVLLGNLMVALLCALLNFQLLFFETQTIQTTGFVLYFSLFAFATTFLREFVKDIQDYKGDKVAESQTFAVRFGIATSMKCALGIAFLLQILILSAMLFCWYTTAFKLLFWAGGLPLLTNFWVIKGLYEQRCPAKISSWCKLTMAAGMVNLFILLLLSF